MKLQLEIELKQTGNGVQAAITGINKVGDAANAAAAKGRGLGDSVSSGLSIAFAKAQLLVDAIERVGHMLFEQAKRGFEFNAELQKGQLLTAAMLTNYVAIRDAQGQNIEGVHKFNAAMTVAADLQDRLRVRALQTGIGFQELNDTMRTILATGSSQIKNADQLLELTVKLTKAGTVTGFTGTRMMQEVRAMMTGNRSELGMMLLGGVSNQQIEQARAQGKLIDLLNERLNVFMQTSERFRGTLPGALGAFKNAWDMALGEGTQGQLTKTVGIINELTDALVKVDEKGKATFNPDFIDGLDTITSGFLTVAKAVADVVTNLGMFVDYAGAVKDTYGNMNAWLPWGDKGTDEDFQKNLMNRRNERARIAGNRRNSADTDRRMMEEMQNYGDVVSPDLRTKVYGPKMGAGKQPPVDDSLRKAMEALKERITLERTVLDIQTKQLQQEQQKSDVSMRLFEVDRQLASEMLRVGGAQLNQQTQSLILQDRMLRMRQTDLDAAIAISTEERKHAEERAKIDKDARANAELARKDPRAAVAGSLFTDAEKAEDDRHKAALEKIAQDSQAARDKARADNKQLARETFADARNLTDERIRQEDAIYGRQALHLQQIEDRWQQLFDAVQNAEENALTAVLQGHGLGAAMHSFADDFASIMAKSLTDATSDWFDMLRRKATQFMPRLDENGRPVIGSDGRPVMDANPSFDPRARAGMKGLQAAMGAYSIYTASQGMSKSSGAASGAISGGVIGFELGGAIGAAVGMVLGAALGAMAGKNKNWFNVSISGGKVNVTGSGGAHAGDVQNAAQQINAVIAQGVNSVGDILTAFPIAIAQGLKTLSPADILKQAGTRQFDDKTLQTFLQVDLPRMILENYMGVIGTGMSGLGFDQAKINQIFNTAKGKGGTDAFAFIKDYITQFVQLKDFVDFVGKSAAGKSAAAAATQKTAPQQLSDLNDRILLLTRGFADLTSDEQLSRIKQINELTAQRYEAEVQYLNELADTAKTVHRSIATQIFGMQMADYGRPTAMLALSNSRSNLMAAIGSAKTPAEIRDLAQQYQELTGQLYQFAVAVRDEFKSLLDGFSDLAARPGKDARAGMLPQDRLRSINDEILKLADNFGQLTSEDQLTRGRQILDLANEAYDVQTAALQKIQDLSKSISSSIEEQIFSIQQDQRNPQEQLEALLDRQRKLYDQLGKANSADEVDFIIGQLQKNADSIYGLEGKNPAAAANTIDMLRNAGDLAQKKLHEFGDQITNSMNAAKAAIDGVTTTLKDSFDKASTAVTDLQTDLLKLDAAVQDSTSRLRGDLDALDGALGPLTGVLAALSTSTSDFGSNLDSTGDSLDRFRDRIDSINDALGTFGGFIGAAASVATDQVERRQYNRARQAARLQKASGL
jgi:hypothetical protein